MRTPTLVLLDYCQCIVPFNRMDAGLVGKELVVLFFMRIVELFVMCCAVMYFPPGVYVRL